jgi:hypothetical protein
VLLKWFCAIRNEICVSDDLKCDFPALLCGSFLLRSSFYQKRGKVTIAEMLKRSHDNTRI